MVYQRGDIGYCSNVHAGETVAEIMQNFGRFMQPVCHQRRLSTMTTGLWISAEAAKALRDKQTLVAFQKALNQSSLQLTSINGFPYGGFHQQRVKEQAYLPDWADNARLQYSKDLAAVLAACLPDNHNVGAISTVPLGYKRHWSSEKQQTAIIHLAELAAYLHQLKQQTGKQILICFEMEPDCVLESTSELLTFFTQQMRPQIPHHEYFAVCYDVCHQAVMREEAYDALQRITDAKITLGKIQLSSALQAVFKDEDREGHGDKALLQLLTQFCEPKYLHQVKSLGKNGQLIHRADLPAALKDNHLPGDWRIHFHVPIHTSHLLHPQLETTRNELLRVFDFLRDNPGIRPSLEVETYSWQVLPSTLRPKNGYELIRGITDELRWVETALQQRELLTG